ncbi:MAG: hypothetical protein ACOCP8_00065 [archaeon]
MIKKINEFTYEVKVGEHKFVGTSKQKLTPTKLQKANSIVNRLVNEEEKATMNPLTKLFAFGEEFKKRLVVNLKNNL